MLYLIGIGLSGEKDITLKGLEAVKKADKVYLEGYTSLLNCSISELEKLYGRKVIVASREMLENAEDHIIGEAKEKNVALLIVGDVFSATTHINFLKAAFHASVKVEVIHNASVLTAVGITGLQLYKLGKVTSIPFHNDNVTEPLKVLKDNQKIGLHTLFLLDLDPEKGKYLSIAEACAFLEKNGVSKEMSCLGCARLGSKDFFIKKGTFAELQKIDFGKPPYCLIIPGKLHFMEEEALGMWK